MLTCGAHIKTASPNVFIGGETVRTGFVFDLEAWTRGGLQLLGIGVTVGAGAFAAMAGVAEFSGIGALGFTGMEGVGMIGDAIGPGYRDLLRGLVGMGMVVSGPKLTRLSRSAADDRSRKPSAIWPTLWVEPPPLGRRSMEWPKADMHRFNRLINEHDVAPLHTVRVVALAAELMRANGSRLVTTKSGWGMLPVE